MKRSSSNKSKPSQIEFKSKITFELKAWSSNFHGILSRRSILRLSCLLCPCVHTICYLATIYLLELFYPLWKWGVKSKKVSSDCSPGWWQLVSPAAVSCDNR